MGLLGGMNWLDVVVFIILIVGLCIGYAQGLLRQIMNLAAFYIGAVLGAQYYTIIAGWFKIFFDNPPPRLINAVGFVVILVIVSGLINWLTTDAYKSTQLRIFPIIDHLGGAALGTGTAAILVIVLLPIIAFASAETWPYGDVQRLMILNGLETSRALPTFDSFKPMLLNALGPWLPGGLPSLFNL